MARPEGSFELDFTGTPPGPWADDAACRGRPARWWDAEARPVDREAALMVCAGCPVAAACGSYADDERLIGIWGGVRRTERSARRIGRVAA